MHIYKPILCSSVMNGLERAWVNGKSARQDVGDLVDRLLINTHHPLLTLYLSTCISLFLQIRIMQSSGRRTLELNKTWVHILGLKLNSCVATASWQELEGNAVMWLCG